MENLKMYCVTNKEVSFLDKTNFDIGWVGIDAPPANYIKCNHQDNIFFKESIDKKYLNLKEIEKRIRSGADIIGRDDKYNKVELDSTFPSYILENKHLFQDWII